MKNKNKNKDQIRFTELEISEAMNIRGIFAPGSQIVINYELPKQPIPGDTYKFHYMSKLFDARYMGRRNCGYLFSIGKQI